MTDRRVGDRRGGERRGVVDRRLRHRRSGMDRRRVSKAIAFADRRISVRRAGDRRQAARRIVLTNGAIRRSAHPALPGRALGSDPRHVEPETATS